MSESDSSYQELDLDQLAKPDETIVPNTGEIEIVDDGPAPALESEVKPAPQAEADDEDDDDAEQPAEQRRKLTRSQRLKAQRDAYAAKIAEQETELTSLREKANKFESNAGEAASISLDLYIKTLDDGMKMLRGDFDKALAAGDNDALWEVQTKMMDLAATKKEAEREKRSIPTKAAPKSESGQEARQPAPTTTPAPAAIPGTGRSKPPPLVAAWVENNKSWFQVDKVMTAATAAIDSELVEDGYTVNDPAFFTELDRRVREAFPHKFSDAPKTGRNLSPTVQSRAPVGATGGKVRVVITAEDRAMADHLGIKIEDYAREKAKRERSVNTPNQYTEIL